MTYQRKEVIGDCTLYLGDCLEVMPTLMGGGMVMVTDPPYGIEDIVGGYGRGGFKTIQNDKTLDVCHAAINMGHEIIKDGWIAAFYSCKVTCEFFAGIKYDTYFGEIIWDKKVPGLGGGFRYQHENIALFKIGNPKPLNAGFSVISDCRNPELHPHQKPQNLMRKLIQIVHGETILDPFMGSGSTIVAAASAGRRAIGIELDPKYFDIACRRVAESYRQPDMLVQAKKTEQIGFEV
jgi:site-specific DNA-methyltransferase (adenine-specific)